MPAMGVSGGSNAAASDGGSLGQNAFWSVSNWYAEKMPTVITATLSAAQQQFTNNNVNPGQFLRGVRLLVRSAGGSGGTATADNPAALFQSLELDNVDGANIMYPMGGYAYLQGQRYFRPWLGDPTAAYDFAAGANPSFTLFVQPEIRHTAGVLSNTDSRSQYKWGATLGTLTQLGITTAPTVTVTPYMDAWAQPDAQDLQGIPNQPLPPGLNLQTIRRHETQPLLSAQADNVFVSHLTGNEIRGMILILRDSLNARQDYAADPIRWTLDNRNLGTLSPDELFNWMSNFYADWQIGTRPTGVYVFPRFFNPGDLLGQGWLATTNATKLQWEFNTATAAANLPGTIELITDEVIPVGPIPSELDHI